MVRSNLKYLEHFELPSPCGELTIDADAGQRQQGFWEQETYTAGLVVGEKAMIPGS